MDTKMNGLHPHFQRWLVLLPIVMVMVSCNFRLGPGAPTTPASQGSTGTATQTTLLPQGSTGEATQTTPAGGEYFKGNFEQKDILVSLVPRP